MGENTFFLWKLAIYERMSNILFENVKSMNFLFNTCIEIDLNGFCMQVKPNKG